MDSIVIERLHPAEIDQVVALIQTIVPFDLSPEYAREAYAKMLQDENHTVLVAKRGSEILGTVTAICCRSLASNFLVLEDVVVKSDCKGCGIGSQLMDAADAYAQEKHCTYCILVSSGFRKEAHRFYEKHGFVEDVRGFRKGY